MSVTEGESGSMEDAAGLIRIGELSRRVGISPHVLRIWERRYGVLRPTRTRGGFRLYSREDEGRVRLMQRLVDEGYSPAAAARMALADPTTTPAARSSVVPLRRPIDRTRAELGDALESFDELSGQRILDKALAANGLDTVLRDLVLPYLRDLGERWHAGTATIAQEHFASNVVRSRLLSLARGWDTGTGPRAILACAPGERHDIGLVCFGLTLRGRGWRVTFLGADTPLDTVLATARELHPHLIVLTSLDPGRLADEDVALATIARQAPLLLAGPGTSPGQAERVGAQHTHEDPVTSAIAVAERGGAGG